MEQSVQEVVESEQLGWLGGLGHASMIRCHVLFLEISKILQCAPH